MTQNPLGLEVVVPRHSRSLGQLTLVMLTVLGGTVSAARGSVAPGPCPASPPPAASGPPARSGVVLAGGVTSIRMCHYGARRSHPRLLAGRLTRRPSVVGGLVDRLNSLPLAPRRGCPPGDGSEVLLIAGYAHRSPVSVTVGLTGCQVVRRGPVVRSAARDSRGRALIAELVGEP